MRAAGVGGTKVEPYVHCAGVPLAVSHVMLIVFAIHVALAVLLFVAVYPVDAVTVYVLAGHALPV